jgi:cytochrome P450 family 4 subfamily V
VFDRTEPGKEHKRCLDILHGFTRKVIRERDQEFEDNNLTNQKRVAFLDILLKAKHDDNTITFEDIQEEVDTFMFEGHDTTAAAASWACHLIGSHPEVQKKLHEEMDAVFGRFHKVVQAVKTFRL